MDIRANTTSIVNIKRPVMRMDLFDILSPRGDILSRMEINADKLFYGWEGPDSRGYRR